LIGEVLGASHPLTSYARGEVAGALERAGRADEAVELYKSVIRESEVNMADQPYLGQSWDTLGLSFHVQRRNSEAIEAFSKALEIYENAGLKPPNTLLANTQIHLADSYNLVGRLDESYNLLHDSVLQLEKLPKEIAGHQLGHSLQFMAFHAMLHMPHRFPEISKIAARVGLAEDRDDSLEMTLRAGTCGQCTLEEAEVMLIMADRLLAQAPNEDRKENARYLRGRALWALGRTEEALELLAEEQSHEHRVYQTQLYKALCLSKQGEHELAYTVLIDAINSIHDRLPNDAILGLHNAIGDEIPYDPNAEPTKNEILHAWEQTAYAMMAYRIIHPKSHPGN
jgi:tetratricopeptide (TPR) repeat protein